MKLEESICPKCGGKLKKTENDYECESCGSHFTPSFADDYQATLIKTVENVVGKVLAGQKIEKISRLKRELWEEIRNDKPFIDSPEILRICSLIRSEVDNDFFTNFFLIANSDSVDFKKLNDFLEKINVEENRPFIDKILEFLLRSPTLLVNDEVVLNIAHLIDETYPRSDKRWKDFRNKLENQKKLKERDVFVANKPRDVFVAYSSKDQENNKNKVSEIVKYLESCGLSCFVAYRNLQRGSGATRDYKNELKSAIKNCTVFLLISSKNSRNSPDVRDEMRFVTELSNGGTKKPRVEYLLEDYDYKEEKPDNINKFKGFFGGLVWISGQDKRELKERIIALKEEAEKSKNPSPPYVTKPSGTASEKPKATEKPRKSLAPVMIIAAVLLVMTAAVGWLSGGFVNWDWLIPSKNEDIFVENDVDIFVENDVKYRKTADGSYIATGLTGNLVNLTVPSALSDGPVIAIGEKAFAGSPLLESVIIEEGIDSVGAEAFSGCSKLKKVDILAEIDVVRDKLFSGCPNLVSVKLPSSVNSIGNSAFLDCVSLSEISLPDNLKSLGSFAFGNCSGLTSVTLPESLVSIGENVFKGCDKLTSAVVPVRALSFLPTQSIEKLTIDGGESVPKNSFENSQSLKTLVLGESVTSVNDWAFYNCSSLSEIVVRNTNAVCSHVAFLSCDKLTYVEAPMRIISNLSHSSISRLKITGGVVNDLSEMKNLTEVIVEEGVTEFSYGAFKDCTALEKISLPDSTEIVGDDAFSGCTALKFNLYENAKYLGNESNPYLVLVRTASQAIKNLTVHPDARVICNDAFHECPKLVSVDLGNVRYVGTNAFSNCILLESANLGTALTYLDEYAFYNCEALKTVSVPDTITKIDTHALLGCRSLSYNTDGKGFYLGNANNPYVVLMKIDDELTEYTIQSSARIILKVKSFLSTPNLLERVIIPDSVVYIGYGAFQYCRALKEAVIPDSVSETDNCVFEDCESLTSVIFGNGLKSVSYGMFSGCSALADIYIPEGISYINPYAFDGCVSLSEINVSKDNPAYRTIDGNLYSKDSTCLHIYAPGKTESTFTVPEKVTTIGDYAFSGCKKLTEIVVGENVSAIGYKSFGNCSSLSRVVLPSTLTKLSADAFSSCENLTEIVFLGTVEQWNSIVKFIPVFNNVPVTTVVCTDGIAEIGG